MQQGLSSPRRRRAIRDQRQFLREIARGLLTHDAAAAAREQETVAATLRSRQIRPRRIAVLGATGGVGTTTVAALLASVLTATRHDQALLLSLHSDASDAAARLAVPQAPSITSVVAGLSELGRIPPSPVTSCGVRVLAAPAPSAQIPHSSIAAVLDVAAGRHPSVVIDAGVATRHPDLAKLAELVDTLVLVTGTTTGAVRAAEGVVARWNDETARAGLPKATRLLVTPVHSRPTAGRRGVDVPSLLRADATPAMPHDGELALGRVIHLSRLSGATMTSMLRLAAEIMGHR